MWLNMGEWILTSSILIMMVLLIRFVFKNRLTAKLRYGIWLLVLVRLLLPISLFDSSFSFIGLLPGQNSAVEKERKANYWQEQTGQGMETGQTQPTVPAMDQSDPQGNVTGSGEEPSFWEKAEVKGLLWGIWTAGMAVTALVIVGSNLKFLERLKKSRKRLEELWNDRALPLYLTDVVSMPCMFGLLRPAVYVREQDSDNKGALPYILKHEYTHYSHRDHIWSALRGLCLVLHWYNPLVWIAAYFSKQDSEFACDESVVRGISDQEAREYGKVLLSLSLPKKDYRTVLSCATTFGGGKNYLKERIRRIAERPRLFLLSTVAVAVLCIGALLFTFTGSAGEEDPGKGVQPSVDLSKEDLLLFDGNGEEDSEVFVRDYLADMNGDGIQDILRLSAWGEAVWDESLDADQDLRRLVENNWGGYYQIAVYDGARAGDTQDFRQGENLDAKALVETFELATAHVGMAQYSYYIQDGKGYLVCNSPYMIMDYGSYTFEVFTYTGNWEKETVEEASVSFTPFYMEEMQVDREEFIKTYYPIEDMVDYTKKLKAVLDRSVTIMDTSMDGRVIFSTCYEDELYTPNAYDIWSWDNQLRGKVNSPESLREALTKILDEICEENGLI